MTIAPFSFPRNFSKSSFVFASKYTTGPRSTPLVPGDHPADAIVSGCPAGLTMRACAVPRVQECAIVHGSRRSEEHTSELQSRQYLVCRLLLEKKKRQRDTTCIHRIEPR